MTIRVQEDKYGEPIVQWKMSMNVLVCSNLASEHLEQDADVAAQIIRTVANPFASRRNFGRVDAPNRNSESSDSAPIPQRVGTVCALAFHVFLIWLIGLCLHFSISIVRLYYLFVFTRMSLSDSCSCILCSLLCVHLLYKRFLEKQEHHWRFEPGSYKNPSTNSQRTK